MEENIEVLQAELEKLKADNLKREIEAEQAKIDEAEDLKKIEAEEKLREQLREEEKAKLMEEIGTKETVTTETPENLDRKGVAENFRQNMIKKHNLTGLNYEDRIIALVDKGLKWRPGL